MDIYRKIKTKKFRKKEYSKRYEKYSDYLLTPIKCKIGNEVICCENGEWAGEKFIKAYYSKRPYTHFTIGKFYKVLKKRNRLIKIINDVGQNKWVKMDRFLYDIQSERRLKLERLK